MLTLRSSALGTMGHCHHMRGIHKLMQLLLDSRTHSLSKTSLNLVMVNTTIRTTVTLYNKRHRTSRLAEGMRHQHNVVLRAACIDARSVRLYSQSVICSSMSIDPTAKPNLTLTRYQADTSGFTSLPTSARITAVRSASVRSATSSDTLSQSTPQKHRSPMTYFVRTPDASMRKEEAKSAREGTTWPDTSARSTREARRFLMPRALPVRITSREAFQSPVKCQRCRRYCPCRLVSNEMNLSRGESIVRYISAVKRSGFDTR